MSKTTTAYEYVCNCNVKIPRRGLFFQECSGKLWIKFPPQIQTSRLVEYYSCDWLTCRSQVIMLTVDRGEKRRRSIKTNKMSQKNGNGEKARCFLTEPTEASNHIGDKCLRQLHFYWKFSRFVSAVAVYFHFQLRGNKSSLPLYGLLSNEGKSCPRIVFPHYCGRHRL